MDEIDKIIIHLLKENGRMSLTELGEHIGISRVAVRKRIKKLEEVGIICGYKAVIKCDDYTKAHILIKLEGKEHKALIAYLKCISYLTNVDYISDGRCILAIAEVSKVEDLDYLKIVLHEKFSNIINDIKIHMVDKVIKDYGGATMIETNEKIAAEMNKYLNDITVEELMKKRNKMFHYKVMFNKLELANDIDVLNLSQRSYNCLKRAGVYTIGDLINKYDTKPGATSREQLKEIRNLGAKSANEIIINLFFYHFLTIPENERAAYMDNLVKENP